MRGTLYYVAPEYGGCGCPTGKQDIYSNGSSILLIVPGSRPLHVLRSPMVQEKANLIRLLTLANVHQYFWSLFF